MLSSPVAAAPQSAPARSYDLAGLDPWGGEPAPHGDGFPAWETTEPPVTGPAALAAGRCCAWPLPLDETCAAEARGVFREALAGLGLPKDLIYDGMTMASELAANTLHARRGEESGGAGLWPVAGGPELWIYLRHAAGRWELACKLFDSLAWLRRPVPAREDPDGVLPESVSGRGLQVVAGLSGGRWGHHLTRSRLGGWKVPGKAVWFALPVPAASVPVALRATRIGPCQAARRLELMLSDRGLGGSLLRADEPGARMSVLSVRCGLTVWCRSGMVSWRTRGGDDERHALTDLEEAAEQIVRTCEEMDHGADGWDPGPGRVL